LSITKQRVFAKRHRGSSRKSAIEKATHKISCGRKSVRLSEVLWGCEATRRRGQLKATNETPVALSFK
jgi:hypothetical protein